MIYGGKIESTKELFKAIEHCHSIGVQTVIISSSKPFDAENTKRLVLYASTKTERDVIRIEFDQLTGTFYGTGDAFAAMFLSWLTKLKNLKVNFYFC